MPDQPLDTTSLNADSYVSVADADQYFANHNSPVAWTGATTAVKDSALRYATAWLDGEFFWVGYLADLNQARGWPRLSAYDFYGRIRTGIPQEVKDATCELALSNIVDAALNKVYVNPNPWISLAKAGSVEVQYRDWAPTAVQYSYIIKILKGLYTSGGSQVGIVRS